MFTSAIRQPGICAMSASDAVDGSSARNVSAMDVGAVKAPKTRRSSRANRQDNRSRHREVGLLGLRRRCSARNIMIVLVDPTIGLLTGASRHRVNFATERRRSANSQVAVDLHECVPDSATWYFTGAVYPNRGRHTATPKKCDALSVDPLWMRSYPADRTGFRSFAPPRGLA
jgi:hypothetical protein